ncbi:6972_t:CDS:2, partial [Gigaspora margarita]
MLTRALIPEQDEELQEIINKRFCDEEEIPKVNTEPENLILNLIKNIYREILSRKELERNKRPIYKLYQKSTEISHNDRATKIGDLGQYYWDSPEVGKSEIIKEKDELEEFRKKETIYFDRLEGLEYDCKGRETDFDSSKGPELDKKEIVSA